MAVADRPRLLGPWCCCGGGRAPATGSWRSTLGDAGRTARLAGQRQHDQVDQDGQDAPRRHGPRIAIGAAALTLLGVLGLSVVGGLAQQSTVPEARAASVVMVDPTATQQVALAVCADRATQTGGTSSPRPGHGGEAADGRRHHPGPAAAVNATRTCRRATTTSCRGEPGCTPRPGPGRCGRSRTTGQPVVIARAVELHD